MKKRKDSCRTFVRWMGAYWRPHSLEESLEYELNRSFQDEVPCEGIFPNENSKIQECKVGLLVNRNNIVKTFNGDCASEASYKTGRLYKTRNPKEAYYDYVEAFAKIGRKQNNCYIGIVIQGDNNQKISLENLKPETNHLLRSISGKYNLPIYTLVKDTLKQVS